MTDGSAHTDRAMDARGNRLLSIEYCGCCIADLYNGSRPHMSLGPGVPDPPAGIPAALQSTRHQIPDGLELIAQPVLGGLHHEYGLASA